jgi:glucarate dehydratase
MKISDIRTTTVTVPLEAPLRHANGCHWGRFVRTVIEVETDLGLVGLGEMGGGGESAEAMFRTLKRYLVGHDPARLEQMRFLIANPTASLYNNRTQVLAALEFACLDILGQKWGVLSPRSWAVACTTTSRSPLTCFSAIRIGTEAARCGRPISLSRRRAR